MTLTRSQTVFLTLLFLSLLFLGAIAFWLLPDKAFSEEENRSLQTMPTLRLQTLLSGAYAEDMNTYFADQFPWRDRLVGVKGACELAMGKGENNGILQGEGGQLAKRLFDMREVDGTILAASDHFDPVHITNAAKTLDLVAKESRYPIRILLPPRTVDVAAHDFSYPDTYSNALAALLEQELGEQSAYVELLPLLRQKHDEGEAVYYKTDHHWTMLGAYYAYRALLSSWSMDDEAIPMDAFEKRLLSDHFRGTFWSAGGMKLTPAEPLEAWYLGDEEDYTVEADERTLSGFYELSHLEGKDQYSIFLDGTHEVVTVKKTNNSGEDRPHLLILKDSFANSLAPFLARHFDLTLLNLSSARMRYTDLDALADRYDADAVLIVYTLGNLVNTDRIHHLQTGA